MQTGKENGYVVGVFRGYSPWQSSKPIFRIQKKYKVVSAELNPTLTHMRAMFSHTCSDWSTKTTLENILQYLKGLGHRIGWNFIDMYV